MLKQHFLKLLQDSNLPNYLFSQIMEWTKDCKKLLGGSKRRAEPGLISLLADSRADSVRFDII